MDVKAAKKTHQLDGITESHRAQQDNPAIALTCSGPEASGTTKASMSNLHVLAQCSPAEVLERILAAGPAEWHGPGVVNTASR